MLWSYSEVLAYIDEDGGIPNIEVLDEDVMCAETASPLAAFGGFKTWPDNEKDFILIAENSEIHGPNPLFTIPHQYLGKELNHLSTQILSADYQGLSNNKSIAGKNAQLLMTDIAPDLHAAVNHFILFDSDARGFVRPVCLAYITSDKMKLINLAEEILDNLNKAASFMQHSNIKYSKQDLKNLHKSALIDQNSDNNTQSKLPKNLSESVLKDMDDICRIMDDFEVKNTTEWKILRFLEKLKETAIFEEVRNFPFISPPLDSKCEKHLKSLLICSPGGIVLSLYHLHTMYKYFRRRYENIAMEMKLYPLRESSICFGACIRTFNRGAPELDTSKKKCLLNRIGSPKLCNDDDYLEKIDFTFERILLQFLMCEHSLLNDEKVSEKSHQCDSQVASEEQHHDKNGSLEKSLRVIEQKSCCHIVSLSNIWDVLNILEKEHVDLDTSFLEVVKLFGEIERVFFCLLTQMPIIVVSPLQDLISAQSFLTVLSIFTPRRTSEPCFVDLDRQEPITKEDLESLSGAIICLRHSIQFQDLLLPEVKPFVCVLNLKEYTFMGPSYRGCLLSDLEHRLRAVPAGGPVLAIIVSLLSEIENNVLDWQTLLSSGDASEINRFILSKGFTQQDMLIIQKLFELLN